jgi:hypothetical protein
VSIPRGSPLSAALCACPGIIGKRKSRIVPDLFKPVIFDSAWQSVSAQLLI